MSSFFSKIIVIIFQHPLKNQIKLKYETNNIERPTSKIIEAKIQISVDTLFIQYILNFEYMFTGLLLLIHVLARSKENENASFDKINSPITSERTIGINTSTLNIMPSSL